MKGRTEKEDSQAPFLTVLQGQARKDEKPLVAEAVNRRRRQHNIPHAFIRATPAIFMNFGKIKNTEWETKNKNKNVTKERKENRKYYTYFYNGNTEDIKSIIYELEKQH